jgi:hypothetical protein
MRWTVAHEPLIHYAQMRPMRTAHYHEQELADLFDAVGHTIAMDCSEGVTLLCRLAGLRDPNGAGYDGSGYTGTLLAHLPHYTKPSGADVGALVVFGPGAGDHVAMVDTPGSDPLLWSHGAENGPRLVRLSVEKAVHRPPTTFLSIAAL